MRQKVEIGTKERRKERREEWNETKGTKQKGIKCNWNERERGRMEKDSWGKERG